MEPGSEPAVDVELDACEVSGLRCGVFSQVRALLGQEVSLLPASDFPAFSEPRSAPSPVIELIEVREF